MIILSVCPVPDKRHLMTKMSSTLRRSENCRRGRKSRVSSQSAAGDLYCAIISTLCTSSRKTPSSLNALQYKKQPSLYCFTTNQYKTWLQNIKLFALRCKYLSGRSCHLVLFAFLLCCCWTSINALPTCCICTLCLCLCVCQTHARQHEGHGSASAHLAHRQRSWLPPHLFFSTGSI